jgi:hypothetical protein
MKSSKSNNKSTLKSTVSTVDLSKSLSNLKDKDSKDKDKLDSTFDLMKPKSNKKLASSISPYAMSTTKSLVKASKFNKGNNVEPQGPIDWTHHGLKYKYRGETQREEAYELWMKSIGDAKRLLELDHEIMPLVKVERHPLFLLYENRVQEENFSSNTRTKSRLLMKRFILDVQELWLANLQHLHEHALHLSSSTSASTSGTGRIPSSSRDNPDEESLHGFNDDYEMDNNNPEPRVKPENYHRGHGLANRRDVTEITQYQHQIQSVSQSRAFAHAYHTSKLPAPLVKMDYVPRTTPGLTPVKPVVPEIEPISSHLVYQWHNNNNNNHHHNHRHHSEYDYYYYYRECVHSGCDHLDTAILTIDRLLPSMDFLHHRITSLHTSNNNNNHKNINDDVYWRFTWVDTQTLGKSVFLCAEASLAIYAAYLIQHPPPLPALPHNTSSAVVEVVETVVYETVPGSVSLFDHHRLAYYNNNHNSTTYEVVQGGGEWMLIHYLVTRYDTPLNPTHSNNNNNHNNNNICCSVRFRIEVVIEPCPEIITDPEIRLQSRKQLVLQVNAGELRRAYSGIFPAPEIIATFPLYPAYPSSHICSQNPKIWEQLPNLLRLEKVTSTTRVSNPANDSNPSSTRFLPEIDGLVLVRAPKETLPSLSLLTTPNDLLNTNHNQNNNNNNNNNNISSHKKKKKSTNNDKNNNHKSAVSKRSQLSQHTHIWYEDRLTSIQAAACCYEILPYLMIQRSSSSTLGSDRGSGEEVEQGSVDSVSNNNNNNNKYYVPLLKFQHLLGSGSDGGSEDTRVTPPPAPPRLINVTNSNNNNNNNHHHLNNNTTSTSPSTTSGVLLYPYTDMIPPTLNTASTSTSTTDRDTTSTWQVECTRHYRGGVWESLLEYGYNNSVLAQRGESRVYFVPGAIEVGKRGLLPWQPDQLYPLAYELTQVAATFTRGPFLFQSDDDNRESVIPGNDPSQTRDTDEMIPIPEYHQMIHVTCNLLIETAILFPSQLAYEPLPSTYPIPGTTEEVGGTIPTYSAAAKPFTRKLFGDEIFPSPLQDRLAPTIMIFNQLSYEGIDYAPRSPESRSQHNDRIYLCGPSNPMHKHNNNNNNHHHHEDHQLVISSGPGSKLGLPTIAFGYRRDLPVKNARGFREQIVVTLLDIDGMLEPRVFGVTRLSATGNIPGVNARNLWHATMAITEHISRPRSPRDYHEIIAAKKHHGPNIPTSYVTRMKAGVMVGLTSSIFTSYEDNYQHISKLRDIFNKQLALEMKIDQVEVKDYYYYFILYYIYYIILYIL